MSKCFSMLFDYSVKVRINFVGPGICFQQWINRKCPHTLNFCSKYILWLRKPANLFKSSVIIYLVMYIFLFGGTSGPSPCPFEFCRFFLPVSGSIGILSRPFGTNLSQFSLHILPECANVCPKMLMDQEMEL